MEVYVYETPNGRIADFRAYLDGRDHAFDDHRPLKPDDPRWEKVVKLRDPVRGSTIGGQLRYVGTTRIPWDESTVFPIRWDGEVERVDWERAIGC